MTDRNAPSRSAAGSRKALSSAAVAATLALCGCAAVGPNFTAPTPPAAQAYAGPGDQAPVLAELTAETRASGPWWKGFGSPALDAVMVKALAHNQTVAAAQATLERVRAEAQRQKALLAPKVTIEAGYQHDRINTAAFGFAGFPSPTIDLYSIGPTVSYDLDLAGGGRRRLEAARADAQAQGFRADAAYLTLTGNVALQAIKIAALREEIAIVQAVVDDDQQAIDIRRAAEAAGGDSPAGRLAGKRQLEEDRALLPPLQQDLAEARHALAMLAGEAPDRFVAPDFAIAEFHLPASIPVALPSALVRLRPDIRAAEADLHADTAIIGAETARLYPDVRLIASLTQEGTTPGSLTDYLDTAYNLGPSASWTLFDGGEIRADRRAAQAQARADLAQYRQTVLHAFVQVSDVLSALAQDDARLGELESAQATARSSLDEARSAFALGGAPRSLVVSSERQWRQASLSRAQAVGERLADVVELYAATAADWRAAPTAPKR